MSPQETQEFIQLVVAETLRQLGLKPKSISQNAAFRMYGRLTIEKWIQKGWIKPVYDGTGLKKRLSESELEVVAKQSNWKRKLMKPIKTK